MTEERRKGRKSLSSTKRRRACNAGREIKTTALIRFSQTNNHTMMGSTEDPKDGSAVAATVFVAVAVYGVSSPLLLRQDETNMA
jgi:hypothetical protein